MSTSPDRLLLTQTFIRIVEAGSLSAAAAQMNTSQPTISRRLQALERSLGLSLILRSTHALRLTEAGARYYTRARELALAWSEFESDLRGAVDEPQGLLRVVVPHAFGQNHLIGPMAAFLARHPRVSVEWLLHDTPPDFVAEGIDCAVRVGEVSDPAAVAIRIGEVPRVLAAAPALLAGRALPQTPEALAELPWLALLPFYRKEVRLQRGSETHLLAIEPRVTTDSLYAMRNAALLGVGVVLASEWLLRDSFASGELIQLLPEWHGAPLPVYVTYPYAAFYPAKLRAFVEAMRDTVRLLG
ncbi:LysR family transcriptional regulator [Uliginosibacterium sp. TH139]|uniref:LysR family transcriptional regulator n=1 Tax=Uliginosibacterium sp. TH139 TaxID=2067453 RepID=UPI000C7AB8DA|nr:LysR family transcriptional regulator [Uliginosibacterium sp. TH139]PLK50591.1 LysR family transcriptional regulator [Uliginosibacterium sp. TH139]